MSRDLTPDEIRAIGAELRQGNKILAVKLYREATSCSLAEAKDAVDALEAAFIAPPEAPAPEPVRTGLTPEVRQAVLAAMRAKKKIEAIKIYREATGQGLAESKNAVEAMERSASDAAVAPEMVSGSRTPMPAFDPFAEKKKSGCFGVLIATVACVVWFLGRG